MEIIWRQTALNDLKAIRAFIAQDNTAAADNVSSAIRTAVIQLGQYPELGRAGRVDGTRELAIPHMPYIVGYRVVESRVHILTVIHTSRQWPQRL
jgi:addiction module RelE/StbE family toxin